MVKQIKITKIESYYAFFIILFSIMAFRIGNFGESETDNTVVRRKPSNAIAVGSIYASPNARVVGKIEPLPEYAVPVSFPSQNAPLYVAPASLLSRGSLYSTQSLTHEDDTFEFAENPLAINFDVNFYPVGEQQLTDKEMIDKLKTQLDMAHGIIQRLSEQVQTLKTQHRQPQQLRRGFWNKLFRRS
jgi:hypothetical protein